MRKPLPSELEPEDARALYKAIGQRILELRTQRKISQRDLADLSGVRAPYIVEIEHGGVNMQLKLLLQFATALGVSPRDLLPGGEVDARPAQAAPLVAQKVTALREDVVSLLDRCNELLSVIDKPSAPE